MTSKQTSEGGVFGSRLWLVGRTFIGVIRFHLCGRKGKEEDLAEGEIKLWCRSPPTSWGRSRAAVSHQSCPSVTGCGHLQKEHDLGQERSLQLRQFPNGITVGAVCQRSSQPLGQEIPPWKSLGVLSLCHYSSHQLAKESVKWGQSASQDDGKYGSPEVGWWWKCSHQRKKIAWIVRKGQRPEGSSSGV